jgi:trk system potassium uptake protein TrkA
MRIIIIGCGRLGGALCDTLSQQGHEVAVIDRDPQAFDRLEHFFQGETVVGAGIEREVLLKAGIEKADGLAAVTSSDEVNIVAARLARQVFRVPRVVARLYDPRKAEVYRRLGLATISHVTWGVSRIVELLCYSHLDTIKSLGSGEVDIVEVEVPHLLVGRKVNDLTVVGEIHVVAITRQGKTFLPTLGTEFQERDQVHLALLASSAQRLKVILGMH